MTVNLFMQKLNGAQLAKNDRLWFPKWIRRYAATLVPSGGGDFKGQLPITTDLVIQFSRTLLANKTPAWQRLQAVRAVEAYRNLVLGCDQPSLIEIRKKLARLAGQERGFAQSQPGTRDEPHLEGIISPDEPEVYQQVRRELRVQGKSLDTERSYVGWVGRFDQYCGAKHLPDCGAAEIRGFLTGLAVDQSLAPSTSGPFAPLVPRCARG